MRVGSARAAASDWVRTFAAGRAEFRGAYFSGSTVALSDDAELPAASDVDVVVLTAQTEAPPKPGKLVHHGVLVEITYLPAADFVSAEHVLTSYHLAGSFRVDTIIADPTGQLRQLQTRVSRQFADPRWIRRRCENARSRIETGLRGLDATAPWHQQVTGWLFATSVTTHVLLVAALRNPTTRLRYLAAREVLVGSGQAELYPDLLELLGCAWLSPERVEDHIAELGRTFDAAESVARTPFFFSTDISAAARPIAIEGSRELVRAGWHREAVFWIVATFARCHTILAADAPAELKRAHEPAFAAVLADIGIASRDDLVLRAAEVTRFLPRLDQAADTIIAAGAPVP